MVHSQAPDPRVFEPGSGFSHIHFSDSRPDSKPEPGDRVMSPRLLVPKLTNPDICVRLARDQTEIEAANRLVCRTYINEGYWDSDEPFRQNPYMCSPMRTVFVVEDAGRIVATASTVRDSATGLPADKFYPEIMRRLRVDGGRLAEVSALAVDKTCERQSTLILFLLKYVYQYSYYYAAIDMFVVVSGARHALFYRNVCGFEKLSDDGEYGYVSPRVKAQLLVGDLLQAHQDFSERFERNGNNKGSFYRFLLVDEHPNLHFPDKRHMRRPREIDWAAQARLRRMPLVV
jgi:hypothetical protein